MRPVSITHPDHFVNVARRRAAEEPNSLFADQFENPANYRAHLRTGEEVWAQTRGRRGGGGQLDAFVSGAGTGGTIAGVSAALKARDPGIKVFLADPPGSGLYNKAGEGLGAGAGRGGSFGWDAAALAHPLAWVPPMLTPRVPSHRGRAQVVRGVMYTREEAEGRRLRHPFDTITEGVGLNRLTANFARARVDGAFKVSDLEAVEMVRAWAGVGVGWRGVGGRRGGWARAGVGWRKG